jgi:hypothetical protein
MGGGGVQEGKNIGVKGDVTGASSWPWSDCIGVSACGSFPAPSRKKEFSFFVVRCQIGGLHLRYQFSHLAGVHIEQRGGKRLFSQKRSSSFVSSY